MSEGRKKLTNKQRVFVDEYLKYFNASKAARNAGYSERSAREIGRKLLTNIDIKAEIDARLAEFHMGTDEALKLLAEIARGDMGDFMAINSMGFDLDIQSAQEAGKTNLIKRVVQKTIIDGKTDKETHIVDIELYDRLGAIRDVLKVGGKLKDTDINIRVTLTDD